MLSKAILIEEDNVSGLKAVISRKLYEKGYKQSSISSLMKITQPMVSKYIAQRYPEDRLQGIADSVVKIIENHKNLSFSFLVTWEKVQQGEEYYIATGEHILSNERAEVITNILESLKLLKGRKLTIVSSVKMNIAMSIAQPVSREDIVSIPGGLIIVNDMLAGYNEPEFGISRHLSQILIYAKSLNKSISSVINIKYSGELLHQLKKQKMTFYFLTKDYKLTTKQYKFDALIHRGMFGIEPICYIFGKSAIEVVEKCCQLSESDRI